MRNFLFVTVGLIVVYFAGRGLVFYFASDETKIGWMVERMADGYNAPQAGKAVSGLARNWTHEGSRADRELVLGGLQHQIFQNRGGPYPYRVEVDEDTLSITVEGTSASLTTEARFSRLVREEWQENWHVRIHAQLIEHEEEGWQVVTSRHENLEGRSPFR